MSTELGSDEILFDYIHPDKIEFSEAHDFAVCIADGMLESSRIHTSFMSELHVRTERVNPNLNC